MASGRVPWQVAREGVSVKLLAEGPELCVLAQSKDRVNKERAMRRRQLKALWVRLKKLRGMKLKRDELLKKWGAALHEHPVAARLVDSTDPDLHKGGMGCVAQPPAVGQTPAPQQKQPG